MDPHSSVCSIVNTVRFFYGEINEFEMNVVSNNMISHCIYAEWPGNITILL